MRLTPKQSFKYIKKLSRKWVLWPSILCLVGKSIVGRRTGLVLILTVDFFFILEWRVVKKSELNSQLIAICKSHIISPRGLLPTARSCSLLPLTNQYVDISRRVRGDQVLSIWCTTNGKKQWIRGKHLPIEVNGIHWIQWGSKCTDWMYSILFSTYASLIGEMYETAMHHAP